jgi:arsenite methyltransferase
VAGRVSDQTSNSQTDAAVSHADLPRTPRWLQDLLGVELPQEGEEVRIHGRTYELRDGILRARSDVSDAQAQTSDAFGFKWHQRDTFESDVSLARLKSWLIERYGDVSAAPWWDEYDEHPVVLDAGCGAAMSSLLLFEGVLPRIHYLGADISTAVDVAAKRFGERRLEAAFIQSDLLQLPLPPESVDVIFSEGVLHHTDSTRGAIEALTPLLKSGGRFLFYVYRRKGPIREFTDDYVRAKLADLPPEQAWKAVDPLTKLGKTLGELQIEVDVPEDVDLLEIPAGRIDLQRLFYWHVFKAYYDPDLTLDEMNHINYDWYAPRNAHRQSPEEVREWCEAAGLEIERERVEEAGITIGARRR